MGPHRINLAAALGAEKRASYPRLLNRFQDNLFLLSIANDREHVLLMSIEREHPRAAHQVAVDRFNHVSFANTAPRCILYSLMRLNLLEFAPAPGAIGNQTYCLALIILDECCFVENKHLIKELSLR